MLKKTALLLVLAILVNALLFVFIWAGRSFVLGFNPFGALLALFLSLLIATPLAILTVRRLTRYYEGKSRFSPATIFFLGFFIFLIGNVVNRLAFGPFTMDFQFHDTLFVIADIHVMIFIALMFLALSAAYFFYPRIVGRSMNATMGYIHFGVTLIGAYLLYWPVQYTGLAGMPRRYFDYATWVSIDYGRIDVFKMKVIFLFACAQLLFPVNLIYSAIWGKKWRPN